MSIKDLFNKGYSLKTLKSKTQNDFTEDAESKRFIEAYSVKRQRYLPGADFSTASNFARFGLAEEYYKNSIERVYQTYPYDLFLFENEYPRTNGFITFNSSSSTYTSTADGVSNTVFSSSAPQYVFFYGGPHADPKGNFKNEVSAGPSREGISKANIYNTDFQRTNNLEIDPEKGATVEFWMKKDGWADTSGVKLEYLFNIHASGTVSTDDDYVSFRISSYGASAGKNKLQLRINSGSSVSFSVEHDTGIPDIADGKWHHYALTFKNNTSNLYVDAQHVSKKTDSTSINAVSGKFVAAIGALAGPAFGSNQWRHKHR